MCVGWVFFRANSLSDATYILTHFWQGWDFQNIRTEHFLLRQFPVAVAGIDSRNRPVDSCPHSRASARRPLAHGTALVRLRGDDARRGAVRGLPQGPVYLLPVLSRIPDSPPKCPSTTPAPTPRRSFQRQRPRTSNFWNNPQDLSVGRPSLDPTPVPPPVADSFASCFSSDSSSDCSTPPISPSPPACGKSKPQDLGWRFGSSTVRSTPKSSSVVRQGHRRITIPALSSRPPASARSISAATDRRRTCNLRC